ncbi:hypothetical protein N7495_002154 [Penicillium taxi]|uniref:uncharacterized protein n=1 Tax=Penicillium taxi TaxID=168475 RepID=UPI0025450F3E|nr:uncharacterized protein N7495_002154 [Penicillium taxi]KAJ5901626.1 hypothetical protein N7495_002154 [Penicillium taxi]
MAEFPEPLTIRKVSRSQSMSSSGSFPFIPRRKSSLCASLSSGWSGPATSTRTPSLDDTMYQLHVQKIRKPAIKAPQDTVRLGSFDEEFVDEITQNSNKPSQSEIKSNHGHWFSPRLIMRWSSGSWNMNGPLLSSISAVSSADLLSPAPAYGQLLKKHKHGHSKPKPFSSLAIMNLPIACANVQSVAERTQIGMSATSLWTQVHVSVDISSPPLSANSINPPLDIIILLDKLPQPSLSLLAQLTSASSVLISNLTQNHDKIALAYVDANAGCGYEPLLLLGFHTIDTIRTALNTFSQHQILKSGSLYSDVGSVIRQISSLFSFCPRQSFCHIFFVSATPPEHLSVPSINPAIGIHTVTPHSLFPVGQEVLNLGCHIPNNVGTCAGSKEIPLVQVASQIFRQLRTGIHPGSICDVKLFIHPNEGCEITSAIENFGLISLRPGETWTVPIQLHVPATFRHTYYQAEQSNHPIIQELITEIDYLLMDDSPEEMIQPIFTACVEYKHSLLPTSSTVHIENSFTIIRRQFDF